jgi:hypothetical protein
MAEWLPFVNLSALLLIEDVALMLEHLRAMKPGDQPFSVCSFYDEAGKLNIVIAE